MRERSYLSNALPNNEVGNRHQVHCGDNLAILRNLVPDATVDLVYLDPPFNTGRTFQYRRQDHSVTFSDAWRWNETAQSTLDDLLAAGNPLAHCLSGFNIFLKKDTLMAYLVMMAVRLAELRRVMKNTATIYLHLDATASHYLKLMMDAIFGRKNFRNEIIWKRTTAHNNAKLFGRIHDTILCYTKGKKFTANRLFTPYDDAYLKSRFRRTDATGRRYTTDSLVALKTKKPYVYEWNGIEGEFRHPAETMRKLAGRNRLHYSKTGLPMQIRYIDEMSGVALQDIWTDIAPVGSAAERMGYPTQKPQALLERIIRASSNPGDLVLDPFCGCGTTIAVARDLGRRAIGIDINPDAVTMVRARLDHAGNLSPDKSPQVQYQLCF